MQDNSQKFDDLQERNQQVLNNISQLQMQEKKLYDSLDDANLNSNQKKQIINKINEISQMRLNLYAGIKDMYSFYQKDVSASQTTLRQSVMAIQILENQLNESKKRMNMLEAQKYNKLRLVGVNAYYGKRYNAHSRLMKTIVLMCIPLIILAVLANKQILPLNLYFFLSGLIIIIGIILIGYQIIDMSNRDNMNWDEYEWHFDKTKAPSDSSNESSKRNPWGSVSLTCIGSACCYDGTTYDTNKNLCVPNEIYNKDDSIKEAFKGLDKYAYTQAKPGYLNNDISPTYASFSKKMFNF
jgi:hypothetical protein